MSDAISLPLPSSGAARPADPILRRVIGAVRHWWDLRRTLSAIEELDEATLRDIGLDRWELHARLRADRAGWSGHWQRS